MRIALCNEVLAAMALEEQCELAAALGYDGLEIAPSTSLQSAILMPHPRRRDGRAPTGRSVRQRRWRAAPPP